MTDFIFKVVLESGPEPASCPHFLHGRKLGRRALVTFTAAARGQLLPWETLPSCMGQRLRASKGLLPVPCNSLLKGNSAFSLNFFFLKGALSDPLCPEFALSVRVLPGSWAGLSAPPARTLGEPVAPPCEPLRALARPEH